MSSIEIPVLNNEYRVVVAFGDDAELRKTLRRYHYPLEDVRPPVVPGRGMCYSNPSCHPVITLPSFPRTPEQIATLAHEAVHAVGAIFRHIGQPVGFENDEVFAHSVGAVVRVALSHKPKRQKGGK